MSASVVAVTGLHGGDNPQPGNAVIRSLRRAMPNLTIIGLVYDAMESGAYADDGPDVVCTIPYAAAGAGPLLERLDFISWSHPIDVLVPTLDAEIETLIRLEPELAARGIRTCLPSRDAFRARSKAKLADLCRECGCEAPETRLVRDVEELMRAGDDIDFPLMLKGQFCDAVRVEHRADLVPTYLAVVRRWGTPVLVQELIRGGEFNLMAIGDGEGGLHGAVTVRKTVVSVQGKGTSCIVVREPRVEALAAALASRLSWRGPFELELMHDEEEDRFYVIEMNPRFPAWADFPSALGANFPAMLFELATTGRTRPMTPVPVGRFFVRHQIELIGSIDELADLATAGVCRGKGKRS
jgi:carbamoyl-phosphate synthase large subunit